MHSSLALTLETGATVTTALQVLKDHGAKEKKIVIVTLFSTPQAVKNILTRFPDVKLLTSEIHQCCPTHFGLKYFGSDWNDFQSTAAKIRMFTLNVILHTESYCVVFLGFAVFQLRNETHTKLTIKTKLSWWATGTMLKLAIWGTHPPKCKIAINLITRCWNRTVRTCTIGHTIQFTLRIENRCWRTLFLAYSVPRPSSKGSLQYNVIPVGTGVLKHETFNRKRTWKDK